MDLHERRQLGRAERMARVNKQVAKAKAHTRPWRSIISLVLAIAAGSVGAVAGTQFKYWTGPANFTPKIIAAVCIAAFLVFPGRPLRFVDLGLGLHVLRNLKVVLRDCTFVIQQPCSLRLSTR